MSLEAQRAAAVNAHLNGGNWKIVAELVEVESGKRSDRPQLLKAMRLCRMHGATLLIAKLDRLSRNVAFLSNLMEAGVPFTAADIPGSGQDSPADDDGFCRTRCPRFISARTRKQRWRRRKPGEPRSAAGVSPLSASRRLPRRDVQRALPFGRKRPGFMLVTAWEAIEDVRSAGATTLRAMATALNRARHSHPHPRRMKNGQQYKVQRVLARTGSSAKPAKRDSFDRSAY